MNIIQEINDKISELERQKEEIQELCSHPVNDSTWNKSEDEYGREDGPGYYSHICRLCTAR